MRTPVIFASRSCTSALDAGSVLPRYGRAGGRLLNADDVANVAALRANLVERTVGDDATTRNDDGARAGGLHFLQVVGREKDRALFADLLQIVEKFGLFVRVEVARGLIQDEDRRVVDERLREADALTIAVRELANVLVEDLRETAHFDDAARALLEGLCRRGDEGRRRTADTRTRSCRGRAARAAASSRGSRARAAGRRTRRIRGRARLLQLER